MVAGFAVWSRQHPYGDWLPFGWALVLMGVGMLLVLPPAFLTSTAGASGAHHASHVLYVTGQGAILWMAWVMVPSHHRAATTADGPNE